VIRTESVALQSWLQRIESLHPSEIELGLARLRLVAEALNLSFLTPGSGTPRVITVAGTNGKGSTCALLSSLYRAAGYRTGVYASPHLWHYCERVKVHDEPVADALMVQAFEAIEQARGDIPLTYFEYGTLAAFYLFQQADLDVVILEVGLGGRLDAVNLIDADVAVVTNVGLDHQDWLGDDRETIAREKAGVYRAHKAAIFGQRDLPQSLAQHAENIGAELLALERDFSWQRNEGQETWQFHNELKAEALQLPLPALPGRHQLDNAAAAVMAVCQLQDALPVHENAMAQGLRTARMLGRLQWLEVAANQVAGRETVGSASVKLLLDVAHNADGSQALADYLREQDLGPQRRVLMVFSALGDKDLASMLPFLSPVVSEWFIAPLNGPRGRSLGELQQGLAQAGIEQSVHGLQSIAEALQAALSAARHDDFVVVCGSFLTVAAAAAALNLEHEE
jgi:dihydrofolate synthase/folylpolyglutamate synthase